MVNATNHPSKESQDDISLTEIAVLFIRRRKLLAISFLTVLLLGLGITFLIPQQYSYTTLYLLSQTTNEGTLLDSPETVTGILNSQYLPVLKAQYRKKYHEPIPFSIEIKNPPNTKLIEIISKESASHAPQVKEAHQALINQLSKEQDRRFAKSEDRIKKNLQMVKENTDLLKSVSDAGQALANAYEKKQSLQETLDSMRQGKTLAIARISDQPTSISRAIIAALVFMLATMISISLVLISAFADHVRQALDE